MNQSSSPLNHDQSELVRFSKMAKNWWDKEHGSFKLIHRLNPLRVNYIEQHSNWVAGKKLLDVGCGAGILSEQLARNQAQVTGIDLADQVITVAQQHALEQGLTINYLLQSTSEHAKDHQASYDIICCMEMLEHVSQPQAIINDLAQMLKPGGLLFMSTINNNLKAHLAMITIAEDLLKMIPQQTHISSKFIKPYDLHLMALQAGLEFKHLTGYAYNPFTEKFKLTSNVDVNYMTLYQKPL